MQYGFSAKFSFGFLSSWIGLQKGQSPHKRASSSNYTGTTGYPENPCLYTLKYSTTNSHESIACRC